MGATNIEDMDRPRRVVALKYSPKDGDGAPRVVATGKGELAEHILRVAKDHGVPLRRDPHLADALAGLDLGSTIPPELFRVVAEILAFVYKMNKSR